MSCTPTSTGCFLSPSDEGRFVSRSSDSLVDASSVTEHLSMTAKQSDTIDGEKTNNTEEVDASASGSGSGSIKDAKMEPAVVADDEKSAAGIVGATICFTPEPSPHSTPNPYCVSDTPNLFGGSSNDYICGANGAGGGESKLGSSAKHVASSLDGRSTTEYEILDGIYSIGTIDVEDLIADTEGEDVKTQGNRNSVGRRAAEKLATLSPCSTVASDTPFKMLKTPHPPEKETAKAPGVDQPLTPTGPESLKLDSKAAAGDTTKNEDQKDDKPEPKSDQDDTSSKVDGRPLTPFGNLPQLMASHAIKLKALRKELEKASAKDIERVRRREAESKRMKEIKRVHEKMKRSAALALNSRVTEMATSHAAELEALRTVYSKKSMTVQPEFRTCSLVLRKS